MKFFVPTFLLLASLTACQSQDIAPAEGAPPPIDIKNFLVIEDGISGGGQITPEHVAKMATDGYTSIINLRPNSEDQPAGCVEAAAANGIDYTLIPVTGTSLTREHAAQLHAALLANKKGGHVLIHCRSGNRVGALWGLHQGIYEKISTAEALEIGAKAGMRSPALAKLVEQAMSN